MKIKHFTAATLAALMCLSSSMMNVFADDTSSDDHTTNIGYTVDESYKWQAPADIVFTSNIDTEVKTGTVSVTENIIEATKTLVISIGPGEDFKLTSAEGAQRDYIVSKESEVLSAGSRVLLVPSGTYDGTQDLNFELQGVVTGNTSQKAGVYTGTLNFVANIETTESGSIDMSNINTTFASGDFSTKGNLVTINSTQYRVLAVNGTQAKVMSMVSVGDSVFNNSNVETSFGSYTGQKYADSKLDQAMTNYYNGLPEAIKTAIVPQTIKQSMYSYTNPMRLANKKAEIEVGQRYVYALDVDDVIDYLGNDYSSDSPYVVNKLFFDTASLVSRYVWLRSASPDHSNSAFFVYGESGFLGGDLHSSISEVRPAFVLDLSLLRQ